MRVRCENCGNFINEPYAVCGSCGAANNRMMRSGSGVPGTIEVLQQFVLYKNIPVRMLGFHIGENYTGPGAFGIYKDTNGEYIVYENKSSGERIIRYRGTDEAFAVNEIYQKLKVEFHETRLRNANGRNAVYTDTHSSNTVFSDPRRIYSNPAQNSLNKPRRPVKIAIGLVCGFAALIIAIIIFGILLSLIDRSSLGGNGSNSSGNEYRHDYDYGNGSDTGYDNGSDTGYDNGSDSSSGTGYGNSYDGGYDKDNNTVYDNDYNTGYNSGYGSGYDNSYDSSHDSSYNSVDDNSFDYDLGYSDSNHDTRNDNSLEDNDWSGWNDNSSPKENSGWNDNSGWNSNSGLDNGSGWGDSSIRNDNSGWNSDIN